MYIPSYQIHNVLNVYRKQLSQGPGEAKVKPDAPHPLQDRINISSDGQRQSIIDRISSEIVDRIAQVGPETRFDHVLADEFARQVVEQNESTGQQDVEFSYTVIDEHNQKVTNRLPIQQLSPLAPLPGAAGEPENDDNFTRKKE